MPQCNVNASYEFWITNRVGETDEAVDGWEWPNLTVCVQSFMNNINGSDRMWSERGCTISYPPSASNYFVLPIMHLFSKYKRYEQSFAMFVHPCNIPLLLINIIAFTFSAFSRPRTDELKGKLGAQQWQLSRRVAWTSAIQLYSRVS